MYNIFKLIITFTLLSSIHLNAQNLNYLKTCIKEHCFDTRIADNPILRAKGLMGETSLPRSEGMLFIFPYEDKPGFWMRGTKIPLDILYINDEDIIVYTVKNAQPCDSDQCPVYKPTRNTSKVLEINGGLSNELGIGVGDNVMYFMENE